ncbi:hypothetical protein GRI97_07350 [Altererythrobacter xixiisoli]|uniref:Uncharacterized protein n=1 Tax=Croceibacterium xixiisoli TaxID=1476466 RepID=A0A6I4TW29_9SPHN|nr:hypothetical protein [Croceibacterium xixiisoli]MXO98798.1 hypothetical protein [Croceibacterium xixiisoli]
MESPAGSEIAAKKRDWSGDPMQSDRRSKLVKRPREGVGCSDRLRMKSNAAGFASGNVARTISGKCRDADHADDNQEKKTRHKGRVS